MEARTAHITATNKTFPFFKEIIKAMFLCFTALPHVQSFNLNLRVHYHLHRALPLWIQSQTQAHHMKAYTHKRQSSITTRKQYYLMRCLYSFSVRLCCCFESQVNASAYQTRLLPLRNCPIFHQTCMPQRAEDEVELIPDITSIYKFP